MLKKDTLRRGRWPMAEEECKDDDELDG